MKREFNEVDDSGAGHLLGEVSGGLAIGFLCLPFIF